MARTVISQREVVQYMRDRRPFVASSLRGVVAEPMWGESTGRMPRDEADKLLTLAREGRVAYVVFSYATPIGYVLTDGTGVVPAVRYSVTTSKQQTYVRWALGVNRPAEAAITRA